MPWNRSYFTIGRIFGTYGPNCRLVFLHRKKMNVDASLKKVDYGSTSHDLTKEDSMGIDHNGDLECDMLTSCSISTTEEPPRLRRIALELSLWINVFVTVTKLVAYIRTSSLSVLAALVDSVLDIVSQLVLNYTEKHSSLQRSSAFYPAGASRLEPVGVLTCAALMGMASFEVVKESIERLASGMSSFLDVSMSSFWSLVGIILLKLGLLYLCQRASGLKLGTSRQSVQQTDPTLEALAQDHWNDALSNGVAAIALLIALRNPHLWWVDPLGAIMISLYIIHSWYSTGKEQVEQLTGKAAPTEFLEELQEIANSFDERMIVDVCRAYHFGPKFLVEIEVVLPKDTLLFESHDLGMELQYEIESREEVERCFVHIDYESRPYDEHVVSKVPELREKYRPTKQSTSSYHSV
jgi:cation diffusion facilitator family transporter